MNEKKSQTRGLRSPPNLQGTTHSACLEQYKHILPTTKKPESSFKDLDIQFLLSNHKAWQPSPVSLYGSSWLPPSCQQMPLKVGRRACSPAICSLFPTCPTLVLGRHRSCNWPPEPLQESVFAAPEKGQTQDLRMPSPASFSVSFPTPEAKLQGLLRREDLYICSWLRS